MEKRGDKEEIKIEFDDEIMEWFQKRSEDIGLSLSSLMEFVLSAYMKKTAPTRKLSLSSKKRCAMGMTRMEAEEYIKLMIEKSIYERFEKFASDMKIEPINLISSVLINYLDEKEKT